MMLIKKGICMYHCRTMPQTSGNSNLTNGDDFHKGMVYGRDTGSFRDEITGFCVK